MKDAYWFSHDSNAKDDPKVMMLIDQLGLEGYGIYWVLIETLRDQPNYSYPIKLLPILAKRYYTSGEKMLAVVKNYELFETDDDVFFFSPALNRRMLLLENKREKAKLAGLASAEKRRQLALSNGRSTDVQRELNHRSTSTVQYSIEQYIKKEVKESFQEIVLSWLKYKKERKDKKYGLTGLKTFVSRLEKLSDGSPYRASLITEQSMANNWAGIFELKEQNQKPQSREVIPQYEDLSKRFGK